MDKTKSIRPERIDLMSTAGREVFMSYLHLEQLKILSSAAMFAFIIFSILVIGFVIYSSSYRG